MLYFSIWGVYSITYKIHNLWPVKTAETLWTSPRRLVWWNVIHSTKISDLLFALKVKGQKILNAPRRPKRFLVFSRCNKDTLACRTDMCPGIQFRLKDTPSWMDKRYLFQSDINQNGSAKAELGRKPSIASVNKECSTIVSNRSLRTELSIDKNICNKTGSCNEHIHTDKS